MPRKDTGHLGNALIKSKKAAIAKIKRANDKHTTDPEITGALGEGLKSSWEINDLTAYFQKNAVESKAFGATKDVHLVHYQTGPLPVMIRSVAARSAGHSGNPRWLSLSAALPIPIRPPASQCRKMSKAELEAVERSAFADWRRTLDAVGEEQGVILAPYEKNLNVWKQLWRVVERAHLLLQIVDGRNPLAFRCAAIERLANAPDRQPDLALPVATAAGDTVVTRDPFGRIIHMKRDTKPKIARLPMHRETVLVVNKADLLTPYQRAAWATYLARPPNDPPQAGGPAAAKDAPLDIDAALRACRRATHVLFFSANNGASAGRELLAWLLARRAAALDEAAERLTAAKAVADDVVATNGALAAAEAEAWASGVDVTLYRKGRAPLKTDDQTAAAAKYAAALAAATAAQERADTDPFVSAAMAGITPGEVLRARYEVGLVGLPNVGKSSAINALIKGAFHLMANAPEPGTPLAEHAAAAGSVTFETLQRTFAGDTAAITAADGDAGGVEAVRAAAAGCVSAKLSASSWRMLALLRAIERSTSPEAAAEQFTRLGGAASVRVSATPGKTKHLQSILLPGLTGLMLVDCPGLVVPTFATSRDEMVCDGVLPIAESRDPIAAARRALRRLPMAVLAARYNILSLRLRAGLAPAVINAHTLLMASARAAGLDEGTLAAAMGLAMPSDDADPLRDVAHMADGVGRDGALETDAAPMGSATPAGAATRKSAVASAAHSADALGGVPDSLHAFVLHELANARGWMSGHASGPDTTRAARHLLAEYISGTLVYVHPPPDYDYTVPGTSVPRVRIDQDGVVTEVSKGDEGAREVVECIGTNDEDVDEVWSETSVAGDEKDEDDDVSLGSAGWATENEDEEGDEDKDHIKIKGSVWGSAGLSIRPPRDPFHPLRHKGVVAAMINVRQTLVKESGRVDVGGVASAPAAAVGAAAAALGIGGAMNDEELDYNPDEVEVIEGDDGEEEEEEEEMNMMTKKQMRRAAKDAFRAQRKTGY